MLSPLALIATLFAAGLPDSRAESISFTVSDHSSPIASAQLYSGTECERALADFLSEGKPLSEEAPGPAPTPPPKTFQDIFRSKMRTADAEEIRLMQRRRCLNPHPPQSEEFEKYRLKNALLCEERWLKLAEMATVDAAYAAAVDARKKALVAANAEDRFPEMVAGVLLPAPYQRMKELAEILGAVEGAGYFDREALFAAFLQMQLTNPLPEEKLRSAYREILPDPEGLLARWKATKVERGAKEFSKLKAHSRAAAKHYGLKRLLARYRALSKESHGTTPEFCAENEASQRRDAAYAKAVGSLFAFNGEDQWQLARNFGVSEGELTAMRLYTANEYGAVNDALRAHAEGGRPLTEKFRVFREVLNAGMDRMPAYTKRPARRFSYLPPKALAEHQVGAIVTYAAFTSASKIEDWRWKGKDRHGFTLYNGGSGKDIDAISSNPGEGEILFKAGTRFKVISREARPGSEPGVYEFVLAEVDEQGAVIPSLPTP